MSKEVSVKEETPVGLPMGVMPAWVGESLATDRKIPRILLMQALSKFVSDEKPQLGDFVKSTTAEKVGDIKHPVKMIVLSFPKKEWIIEVRDRAGKWKFAKREARTVSNENVPWKFIADEKGIECEKGKDALEAKRVRAASFFAILPADLEKYSKELERVAKGEFPDLSIRLSPVQISCRSFSHDAAVEVEEFLRTVARFKREPWEAIVELSAKDMKNEDGKWYVFSFDQKKAPEQTPPRHREAAQQAFLAVQQFSGSFEVDESDEIAAAPIHDSAGPEHF